MVNFCPTGSVALPDGVTTVALQPQAFAAAMTPPYAINTACSLVIENTLPLSAGIVLVVQSLSLGPTEQLTVLDGGSVLLFHHAL